MTTPCRDLNTVLYFYVRWYSQRAAQIIRDLNIMDDDVNLKSRLLHEVHIALYFN
jgi:hypothetical protein